MKIDVSTKVIMSRHKKSRKIGWMHRQYDYAQGGRVVWFILTPAVFLFWLFFLWLAWANPGADTRGLLLVISLFTWPLLFWGALFLVLSAMRVQLQETAVTLHLRHLTHTIPYDDITAVHQNRLFIIIHTRHGRRYLERSIQHSPYLVAELKRRAPALRQAAVQYITAPLPRHLTGKLSSLLTHLGIASLCLFFSLGMATAVTQSEVTSEKIMAVAFSIVGFLSALLALYLAFFHFPRRVTFLPAHITLYHLLRRQQLSAAELQDASVQQQMITYKGVTRPSYSLVLTFRNGRTLTVQQDQVQQSLLEFLPVLEHHYQIKPIHYREKTLIPFRRFGNGSQNDFRWYFERESQVQPATVAEICHWLKQCRYVSDEEQFNSRDHWLHPVEFEVSRQGDCEDHALWAWRKLVELGIPAEFVVGQAKWTSDHPTEAHAWVTYMQDGRSYLLEATGKSTLIYPLEKTASRYHPWYSIDQDFQTYQHNRYIKADRKLSPGE